MQRDYLHVKENPYRQGVLQGNYVEELYASDFKQNQTIKSYYPMSETKSQFQFKGFSPNISKKRINEKSHTEITQKINLQKLVNSEDEDKDKEDNPQNKIFAKNKTNQKKMKSQNFENSVSENEKSQNENEETQNFENQNSQTENFKSKNFETQNFQTKNFETQNSEIQNFENENCQNQKKNPEPENPENKKKDLTEILNLGKSLKKTYEMLSRSGSLEEEEIPFKKSKIGDEHRFKTSYNLSYDLHVKPQVFTKNDWRGDFKTSNTIRVEERNIKERMKRTVQMKETMERERVVKDFSKKNLGFSNTFDVPEILIGWRN